MQAGLVPDRIADASGVVLDVNNLHTEFRLRHGTVHAVDGVSFSVGAGECVGLVGESGCGKSTTGLSIMNLLPGVGHVTSGAVNLSGRDLTQLDERAMQDVRGNDVAMIFQDPMSSLNPTWTVGRQITEAVRLHRNVTKDAARERAIEVLGLVGMPRPEERLSYYPHQLSGGLRQRVMIAMALACEPKMLIADEPTTALDVTIQAQILDLIDDLRVRLQMAVLLITHDMGVIAARANRVIVMYAGKIVESAPTDEIFATPRHPYTEALLHSIPRLDQDRSTPLFTIPGIPPDLSKPLVGCRYAPRCRYVTNECREREPELTAERSGDTGRTDEHCFACFHPVGLVAKDTIEKALPELAETITATPTQQAAAAVAQSVDLVAVTNITKEYPFVSGAIIQRKLGVVHAVSDVSFTLERGRTLGLVGESGCGKTTIGRMVVGLERPTSGTVRFDGKDLVAMSGRELRGTRRDLQLMFQDPYASLDPRMRVGSIVREPLAIQHLGDRDTQKRRARELLDEVGLPRRAAELYPHEFSGGQRQRVGLARALALQPRLIVADEPVSALDVSIQAQILNLMRTLQDRHGLSYLVISHDLAVVKYLADEIGVMYLGKLVEIGPAASVYSHPAHPYTRALIDAIPDPDPTSARKKKGDAVRGELPSAINPPTGCRFNTRCPYAQDICREVEPQLVAFTTGQRAACHFPLETPTLGGAVTTAAS